MSERERFEEGMPGLLKAMRWAYDNFYVKGYSNVDEREGYISALEDDLPVLFGQVDDLVALVARLARSLRKAAPADALADRAMDYLRRKGLNPSPLRTVPEPGQAASGSGEEARSNERTGWPPGLLQDDSRELSRALASKPDAMVHARDAVSKIGQPEAPTAAALVRDAERYRFLRDNDKRHFWPPVHGSMWVVVYHQPPGLHVMPETRGAGYGADLDVAIDAAIAVARSGAGSEEAQPDRTEES